MQCDKVSAYADAVVRVLQEQGAAAGITLDPLGLEVLRSTIINGSAKGGLPDYLEVILDSPVIANWRIKRVSGTRWGVRLAYYGRNAERDEQARRITEALAQMAGP
ncbi:MAG: hypothetical protein M1522_08525 [Actinobacteria bacterium]|nr:hypothetical protein [Actinomycetota bacterium]